MFQHLLDVHLFVYIATRGLFKLFQFLSPLTMALFPNSKKQQIFVPWNSMVGITLPQTILFWKSAPLQYPLHSNLAQLWAFPGKTLLSHESFLVLSKHTLQFQDLLPKPISKQSLFILYFYFTSVSIRHWAFCIR